MISILWSLGWILVTVGAIGTVAAVAMEVKAREPIYLVIMKITTALFGIGGILIGLSGLSF